jgi:hypothetical protein
MTILVFLLSFKFEVLLKRHLLGFEFFTGWGGELEVIIALYPKN